MQKIMNWYKFSFDMDSLFDRNVVNKQIAFFKSIADELNDLQKIVFQDATSARKSVSLIASNKKMSSFPVIVDVLLDADRVALDSPWRFAESCNIALDKINTRIRTLEKERRDFTEKEFPAKIKGWVKNHV